MAACCGGDISFGNDNASVVAYNFGSPFEWSDKTWHLIDVSYGSGVAVIYVDGSFLTSGPLALNTTDDTGLVVGNNGDVSYDEAAVYPTVLSPARIEARWLAGGHVAPAGGPVTSLEQGPGGNLSESCDVTVIHGCSGDPVDDESGVFGEASTDVAIAGRGPALNWGRAYSSAAASLTGPLGYGWSGTYTAHIVIEAATGSATVVQEDGSQIVFTSSGGNFSAPPRVQATLTQHADGTYTLLRRGVEQVNFNAGGQLAALIDRNGLQTTVTYSSGHLSAVADTAGRTLSFNWAAGNITKVTDSTGRTVTYTYTAAGDLATVTALDGAVTTFGYDGSHRLTSVVDPAQALSAIKHPVSNLRHGRADFCSDGSAGTFHHVRLYRRSEYSVRRNDVGDRPLGSSNLEHLPVRTADDRDRRLRNGQRDHHIVSV